MVMCTFKDGLLIECPNLENMHASDCQELLIVDIESQVNLRMPWLVLVHLSIYILGYSKYTCVSDGKNCTLMLFIFTLLLWYKLNSFGLEHLNKSYIYIFQSKRQNFKVDFNPLM